ncbi:MAG: TraR/DksA family transcriptional regulator [Flavobacteriales bacterium]|nr:TraR/DksA family transcriptional regulator [Flavobacteriales bacterium]MBL4734490.1 TraR/DksA family transcriptional regulator [Flavobacteriales bacterium]PCH85136.1 MAG: molecular chaperone DnaK [Flavobacteriales bacterium]
MATKTKNKTKYSKKELDEFRKLIEQKLEKAYAEYEVFKGTISGEDDHGTNDTSPTFKVLEEGSEVLSKEENAQLAVRQKKFIQHLENAMLRIENGSYGICRVTGNLISKERLRAVPHATLSIDAKKAQ